jgi:DNA-binding beta-propeller fold protein YncE
MVGEMGHRIAILAAALLALTFVAASLAATAGAANRIYWADYDSSNAISFANLDGRGSGGTLNGEGAIATNVNALAIDMGRNRVYWSGGSRIGYTDLGGAGSADLDTGAAPLDSPQGVAVDPSSNRIYWADSGDNKISYASLDGGGGSALNTTGATVDLPIGIAIDPAAGRIYWMNTAGKKVSYANLDGSGGGDLNTGAATFDNAQGIAIDPAAGKVYWTNVYGQSISYANLDGSGGGELNTTGATVSNPAGLAIDAAAGRLYWGNVTGHKVSYANLDGSGGDDLATTGVSPGGPSYPVLLKAPAGAGVPAITASRKSLACSRGSWAADILPSFLYRLPASFAYQWSRNGVDIPGATAGTYTPAGPYTAAGAGEYRCTVTASNPAGSARETSDPHTIPLLPPPVLSGLAIEPHAFIAAGKGSGAKASASGRHPKPGANVSFVLGQPASVAFEVERRLPGKRSPAGACVKSKTTVPGKQRCRLLVALPDDFSRAADAGTNGFRYNGRLGSRKLPPGNYLLVATPSVEGVSGLDGSASFTIKPPPAKR